MISFYKSIIDQDRASIVICNLKHEIIYMNPAAVNSYAKRGGDKLIGRSLLDCHNQESRDKIQKVVDWFAADESHNLVYTFHNEKQNKDVYMVALREEGRLIGYYVSTSYVSYTKPIFEVIKIPKILEKSSFFACVESKCVI